MPLSTASTIDTLLKDATADPYFNVPRVSVLVANSHEVLYSGSSGYTSVLPPYSADTLSSTLESAAKVTDESIYDIYSCTKLVAAIAMMQLVEQGLVGLEDDASKWAPALKTLEILKGWTTEGEPILEKNTAAVTVEMLINHTAGFTYAWTPDFIRYLEYIKLGQLYDEGFSRESLVKLPLIYTPGEHWQYGVSNDWLTVVVEEISGLKLEQYFEEKIFKPLGITDMGFTPNPEKMSIVDVGATPTEPHTFKAGRIFKPESFFGGAGLSGSPKSYLKITQALLNGGSLPENESSRILKTETVKSMFEPHLKNDTQRQDLSNGQKEWSDPFNRKAEKAFPLDWGYGGMLALEDYPSGRKAGSLAWSGVASTFWTIDPKSDVTFLVWTNCNPYACKQIFDLWEKVEPEIYKGISAK